jgi:hypothetical protein
MDRRRTSSGNNSLSARRCSSQMSLDIIRIICHFVSVEVEVELSYNNAPRSASEFVRLDSRVEIRVDILGVIFLRVLEQCEIDRVHRRFGFLVLFRLDDLIIQKIILKMN